MDRRTDDGFDDHPLFGPADDDVHGAEYDDHHDGPVDYVSAPVGAGAGGPLGPRSSRRHAARRKRQRRRRGLVSAISVLVVAALVVLGFVLVRNVTNTFSAPDYSGAGAGSTQIRIKAGDGASDIGNTLVKAGVVKSVRAFTNAANDSGQSGDIQPGVYKVPLKCSAKTAVAAILDSTNRLVTNLTVPEGYIANQVYAAIAKVTNSSLAAVQAAAKNISALGIPAGFNVTSAEGFLFPATYPIDPGTSPTAVLQTMVTKFNAEYISLNMAAGAKALNLTPYQVLTIASIAEAEAKFGPDRAKVARVILNRLASSSHKLQVDATSAYAAKLAGKAPTSIVYATYPSVFNTYTHAGLPPTPIGNPGESSIQGALAPPAGTWLFYVNIDAAGHLGFFSDEASFNAASQVCAAKGWGCAG